MFGRADAPATDLAFFKANKLDADLSRIARRTRFRGRSGLPTRRPGSTACSRIGPSAGRNRAPNRHCAGSTVTDCIDRRASQQAFIPDPAHCILAIREARTALAHSPDDWIAFRRLKDAYRFLMVQENAMLSGIPINYDNAERIIRLEPEDRAADESHSAAGGGTQLRDPDNPAAEELRRIGLNWGVLNIELSQLYFQLGVRDLARDRIKASSRGASPATIPRR